MSTILISSLLLLTQPADLPQVAEPPMPDFKTRVDYIQWYREQLKFADQDNAYQDYAGFMRLLTERFVSRWLNRHLNIHPSLLPAFKGLDTHGRVLRSGAQISGCTVHFVRAAMDDGPIVAQAAVPVLPGDTEEVLAGRVLAAEHQLYPHALRLVASGQVAVDGERASGMPAGTGDSALFSPPLPGNF